MNKSKQFYGAWFLAGVMTAIMLCLVVIFSSAEMKQAALESTLQFCIDGRKGIYEECW